MVWSSLESCVSWSSCSRSVRPGPWTTTRPPQRDGCCASCPAPTPVPLPSPPLHPTLTPLTAQILPQHPPLMPLTTPHHPLVVPHLPLHPTPHHLFIHPLLKRHLIHQLLIHPLLVQTALKPPLHPPPLTSLYPPIRLVTHQLLIPSLNPYSHTLQTQAGAPSLQHLTSPSCP